MYGYKITAKVNTNAVVNNKTTKHDQAVIGDPAKI